jgi:hypothetical protein
LEVFGERERSLTGYRRWRGLERTLGVKERCREKDSSGNNSEVRHAVKASSKKEGSF